MNNFNPFIFYQLFFYISEFHRSIHQVSYSKISKNQQQSSFQKQLQQNITLVIRVLAAITTDSINEKLMELQQELVKKAKSKEAYDEIANQIFALRKKRQQASKDTIQSDEQLQRITELQDFIKDQPPDLTVFDEALVKRWFNKSQYGTTIARSN